MGELTVTRGLAPFGPATAILLTDEEVAELGGGRRAAVLVSVGDSTARLRLAVMGGQNCIGLSKAARHALGVQIGDVVTARIGLDTLPREVELPADLAAALAEDPEVQRRFEELAFTHRKEFASWVSEAKRPQTRERRVAQTLEMVREGRTRS